jgi:serine/threonine-protein kinase
MPGIDPHALRQIDRFRVRRFVAEGGNAWVFEVEDPTQPGVGLALKLLKPDAAQGAELARFLAEIEKLVRIQHPNIIRVHDRGQDAATGCHFYTMDFVDGGTLADVRIERAGDPEATRVARRGATIEEVCGYFVGVLAALARLHGQERPILHRDIKPANVLVQAPGERLLLADFGIAALHDGARTQTGVLAGSPVYMAPEVLAGAAPGVASDLYALGALLYEWLTGQTPHRGASLGELMRAAARDPVPAASGHCPGLPPEADRLIAACLARSPAARPSDAAALAQALAAAGRSPVARAP